MNTNATGSSCHWTTVGAMNGTGVDFEAFPYFLLHNVATSTFSSATSSKSAITSTSTSKVKSSANEPGESSGLSTGAKIAIGVCVPAAVLILCCHMFYSVASPQKIKSSYQWYCGIRSTSSYRNGTNTWISIRGLWVQAGARFQWFYLAGVCQSSTGDECPGSAV